MSTSRTSQKKKKFYFFNLDYSRLEQNAFLKCPCLCMELWAFHVLIMRFKKTNMCMQFKVYMVATSNPLSLLKQDTRVLRYGFEFRFCTKLLFFKNGFILTWTAFSSTKRVIFDMWFVGYC